MRPLITTITLIMYLTISGCATHRQEVKAPCDPIACTDRTNVNTWNKGE